MGILGQEIKERRASMNLTQGELGELLGVALNTVSRWENGSSSPESGQMLRLALDQIELNYTITLNDEARDA